MIEEIASRASWDSVSPMNCNASAWSLCLCCGRISRLKVLLSLTLHISHHFTSSYILLQVFPSLQGLMSSAPCVNRQTDVLLQLPVQRQSVQRTHTHKHTLVCTQGQLTQKVTMCCHIPFLRPTTTLHLHGYSLSIFSLPHFTSQASIFSCLQNFVVHALQGTLD